MLTKGRYHIRRATSDADISESLRLRGLCFGPAGAARDTYDDRCQHFLVFDCTQGHAVCSFRILLLSPDQIGQSYSAQYYGVGALAERGDTMLELGRFCVPPDVADPDVLRMAWAALTGVVDQENVGLLFGCSSFAGTDPAAYLDAFSMLKARHLAPPETRPHVKSTDAFH